VSVPAAIRIFVASLAAAGLVGTLAMLAVAAPSHRNATTAEYCQAGDKDQRKADLTAATKSVHKAQALVAKRAAALKKAKNKVAAKKALTAARHKLAGAQQFQKAAKAAYAQCA
jgi:hypothetical protein